MTITTIATWNTATNNLSDNIAFNDKIAEMVAAGKTDGLLTLSPPPHPPRSITRTWTTLADAQEWKDFLWPAYVDYGLESVDILET
jgi:hypothetical protein